MPLQYAFFLFSSWMNFHGNTEVEILVYERISREGEDTWRYNIKYYTNGTMRRYVVFEIVFCNFIIKCKGTYNLRDFTLCYLRYREICFYHIFNDSFLFIIDTVYTRVGILCENDTTCSTFIITFFCVVGC